MALTWKYRGFDYSSYYRGGYTNADSMDGLVATGANAVETTLDWGIDPTTNTVYADSHYTDPLTAEAAVIKEAVAKGLQVMVKPHLDFLNAGKLQGTPYSVGSWRTYYNPGAAGSAGADSFFASYKSMLLQEAGVAVANGATMMSIGTELDQIAGPAYKGYWDDIISSLRKQAPSLKLTFAADWNDALSPWRFGGSGLPLGTGNLATQISFASELDYLGLDVYAPLANTTTPTLQQLVDGWTKVPDKNGAFTKETYGVTGNQSLIQCFEGLSAAVGKPLLFTEIGFENATDAAETPPVSATNAEDDALQALAYQSLFQAFSQSGDTSVAGAFLYNWDPNAAEVGPGSVAFSPQGLPALALVKAAFAAPNVHAPAKLGVALNAPAAVAGLSLDAASTGAVFSVTLSAAAGVLSAQGAASVSGSGTGHLTISGSLADVNATLAALSYTETQAGGDAIHVSASADGGPAGAASISVNVDANPPKLSFAYDTYVEGATVNVSGTADPANAGLTVTYLVNGANVASAMVDGHGDFAANLTLAAGAVNVIDVELTDAAGATGRAPPIMAILGDGVTANFNATNGNVADLFNATGAGDIVNGSHGTIVLSKAKAQIVGGGNAIYADGAASNSAALSGTSGDWDYVQGANVTVAFATAQASVVGANETILLDGAVANAVSLYDTAGAWDLVQGAHGEVMLTHAQASLVGGGDAIYLSGATDNAASLYNTGGAWDVVRGANAAVMLTHAQVSVVGGNDAIYLSGDADNAASLYDTKGAWDLVQGAHAAINLTHAQASFVGGANTIFLSGAADNAASLYDTHGEADAIYGANGSIALSDAQADVTGDGDMVYFAAGAHTNALNVNGGSETFVFPAAYGHNAISGFAASDVLQFASADWTDYADLLGSGALTQGASGATIAYGANEVVLTGVAVASLTQANFRFA